MHFQRLIAVIQIRQSRFKQAVTEAVSLQCVQDKWLLIRQRHFGRLKEHLQSLTEEVTHRVTQEILQLAETQRFILHVGIKPLDISRLLSELMQHLPLTGVTEQVIAFMKIASAERLERVFLRYRFKQVFVAPGQSPTAREVIT
ncbi:hypothetical protein D3C87_1275230 [compost metagenome]